MRDLNNKGSTVGLYSSLDDLSTRLMTVRRCTEKIVGPLETEDFLLQAMTDVSPPKWHLAHTTWFFERFVLKHFDPTYEGFHPAYDELFNSYYLSVGCPYPRAQRGFLSRPTLEEIRCYRKYVEESVVGLCCRMAPSLSEEIKFRIELGLQHEKQHQELLLTDIKYNFSVNPLKPVYQKAVSVDSQKAPDLAWKSYEGGMVFIGHPGSDDHGPAFAFDNEQPRHKVWVEPFAIANRPVTNGEFIRFIEDGGYETPAYWLSDGWAFVEKEKWHAPLYWEKDGGSWYSFTLQGFRLVCADEPVCHISYYEADAYARWAGFRLPTEVEWEHTFRDVVPTGNFLESGYAHPVAQYKDHDSPLLYKGFGDVWEWTMSPYMPYPGYRPLTGALGEYNGKFMSNQMVLRGGSCVTPLDHIRVSYRNFFQPEKRWQFTGFRLAVNGS